MISILIFGWTLNCKHKNMKTREECWSTFTNSMIDQSFDKHLLQTYSSLLYLKKEDTNHLNHFLASQKKKGRCKNKVPNVGILDNFAVSSLPS